MKKRSEFRSVVGAAFFAMAFCAMVVAFPKAVSAGKPVLIQVDEAGTGGATLTQGPCTGNNAPSCEGGHTCECVTFSIGVSDAKSKPRRVAIESQEGTLGTALSIDLTDQTDNGAGGFCFPWNGIGTLTIHGSTVTLPELGRVCQVGASTTTLSCEGTHDLESGTNQFQNSQGQGTISFTIQPSTSSSTGAPALNDTAGLTWDDVFWILCPLCTLCNQAPAACD